MSQPSLDQAITIWGDDTYLYVADYGAGVHAYTFDGVAFSRIATYDTPGVAVSVWGDGRRIFVGDEVVGAIALEFDGNAFTLIDAISTVGSAEYVWSDGTYVYVAERSGGLRAYAGFSCACP